MADPPPQYTPPQPQSYQYGQPGDGRYQTGYGQPIQGQYTDQQKLCPGQQNYGTTGNYSTYPQPRTVHVVHVQKDYRLFAILVCLFCFWPAGIFAIYYASMARDAYLVGNTVEGQLYQGRARRYTIISLMCGVVLHAAWLIAIIIIII